MTSEDQDILAKIGLLAGQINRHKNQQQTETLESISQTEPGPHYHYSSCTPSTSNSPRNTKTADLSGDNTQENSGWRPNRGSYPSRSRGYFRGGRIPQVHRNKTLVLNGGNAPANVENTNQTLTETSAGSTGPTTSSAWVTKTDRHLQLINPAIFEKQSQQRAKAIEETRKLKLRQRDERERLKLSKHLQRHGHNPAAEISTQNASSSTANYELTVQGMRFRVVKNGSKLVKIAGENAANRVASKNGNRPTGLGLRDTGDENAAKATPKTAIVGGVRFYRSKNGNLYRSGIVRAQRYDSLEAETWNWHLRDFTKTNIHVRKGGAIKKINEPCKAFSTTGTCVKGPKCRYLHDPSKVAVCKDFLQKGSCTLGDSCDLSHELSPERTPACLHFAKGNCSNANCRYAHVRVSPSAHVCRPFGIYGYCEKGLDCEERHVHECPDFSNTGVCNTKGCKLPHKLKASIIRKNAARGEQGEDDGNSDLSSDEDEEEIDSDDVDSDDLDEEYFGDGGSQADMDIPMQQDFVQL